MNYFYAKMIRKLDFELNIHCFDDKTFLEAMYLLAFDEQIDWKNPKTFNAKLQWLKLNDRKDSYIRMVDKYLVKDYVKNKIGEQYIIPTLSVWDSFDDIEFDKLPNKFVLKCTHDSGGIVICKDKKTFDLKKARNKINKSLKRQFYYVGREWPYKGVIPKIICEQYIEDQTGKLNDYKFFCFNGNVRFFKIDYDRDTCHRANYYDCSGELLPFDEEICPRDPNKKISIPNNLKKMIELAESLSKGIDFLRVDFYSLPNNAIKFGELTFYPGSGFIRFIPKEYDYKIGEMLKLSNNNKNI